MYWEVVVMMIIIIIIMMMMMMFTYSEFPVTTPSWRSLTGS